MNNSSDKITILKIWRDIESLLTTPARIIATIIFYVTLPLVAIEHFFPNALHFFVSISNLDTTDLLLSLIIFIMSGILKLLFDLNESNDKRFSDLGHIIANGSLTQFHQEVDAISLVPELISSIDINRIDIIQISGQNIIDVIERIAKQKPGIKFRLLLLDPELANCRFSNQRYDSHVSRVMATLSQIYSRSLDSRVEVRFYKSEPSVCAIIADDHVAVLSWYRSYFENGDLVIHGHNSAAVVDNRSESGALRKFAQSHFSKVWNCAKTYNTEHFTIKVKVEWRSDDVQTAA